MVKTEALERNGVTVLDEFAWDEVDTLRPGVDFKDGVTYVTIPIRINTVKKTKKGKDFVEEIVQELGIGCVTSEKKHFAYTEERVADFGFAYPRTVLQPQTPRWSNDSVKSYINGEYKAPHPVNIFNALQKVYKEHVEYTDQIYYTMMPLFVMSSYMFRSFNSIGYVHFNGTAQSGKSVNLSLLKAFGFNTVWVSNMTTPSLFRTMAGNPGLMCIDEAESFDGERGEELRRILNAGYLKGSTVMRTEAAGDKFIVVEYESFGPKAIASINPLEPVIGSRCVVVSMRPVIRKITEFDMDAPKWTGLRDRLYLWLMDEQGEIYKLAQEWAEETRNTRAPKLLARQWQITQAYIVLADYLDKLDKGNRCDELIAFFTQYFAEAQKQLNATDRIRLVLRTLPRVLATVHPSDGSYYPLKSIHEVVSQYLEEDQKEYFKTRTLGKYLDVLGFKNKRPHRQGQQVWITADQVRQEFRQRQVEPDDEDAAWLRGEVEYNPSEFHTTSYTKPIIEDIWSSMPEEGEN